MIGMLKKIDNIAANSFQPEFLGREQATQINDDVEFASKILFVIVLYKVRLTESLTFQSLNKTVKSFLPQIQVDLLICDNSPTSQFDINEDTGTNAFNVYYLHDSVNPGISLSYNRAVELALIKEKKWLLVLDQDTILPTEGLRKYINALKNWPDFPVYTPQVYSGDTLLSPCRYFMHRGSPFTIIKPGVNILQGKNVINSGLLINVEAYREVGGYDEKVWLYFSDFVFFDRLKKHYKKFIVLDFSVEHELSSSDYSDLSFAINRFTYYCQGAKAARISDGSLQANIGYTIAVGLRSILMCRRFGNTVFLKIYIKSILFK